MGYPSGSGKCMGFNGKSWVIKGNGWECNRIMLINQTLILFGSIIGKIYWNRIGTYSIKSQ
jgi:hypothetical protein